MTSLSINDEQHAGAGPEPSKPLPVRWDATASGDTRAEQAHNLLKSVVTEHGRYIERVAPLQEQMTPEGYQAQLQAFGTTNAAKAVDTAEQLVTARREQAQADYQRQLSDLSPRGDAAAEVRNQRTLSRIERQLAGVEPSKKGETATRLIAAADREALGVILQELPSLGVPHEVIVAAAAQAVPELGAAVKKLGRAQQAEAIVRSDAKRVRDGIAQGHKPYAPLVDIAKYDPDRF